MKILLNVHDLTTGGAERVAVLLAKGLHHLGHTVIIAACSHPMDTFTGLPDAVEVISMNVPKPLVQASALAKIVDSMKPDAVIAFGINLVIGASISRLRWRWKCPLIFRNECNLALEWRQASPLNRMIGPSISRLAARHTHVVAVSHSLATATANFLFINPKRITTILNPVIDDTLASNNTLDAPPHPWLLENSDIPTFVAVSRLDFQKGLDFLISAFANVQTKTNARLIIFGKGPLRDALQEKIKLLKLENSILLAGRTENPMTQMRSACAFILSSRSEGFGLVLVEALWAGTQVISTNCDYGPAEILEGGRYGTLVPVEDCDALANAMLDVLRQPRSIQRPPDAWFEKFTATEAARQHVALIESVGKGRHACTLD